VAARFPRPYDRRSDPFQTFNFGPGWVTFQNVAFQHSPGLMAYDNIVVDADASPFPALWLALAFPVLALASWLSHDVVSAQAVCTR